MSESATPQSDTSDRQPGESPVRIAAQYIKDLSFEVPGAPNIFANMGAEGLGLQVSIDVKTAHGDNNAYEVVLHFQVAATVEEKVAFSVELQYGCVVLLDETIIPQAQVHPLLNIEIPRMLFPFARQIIANLCSDSGFPQMLLQAVDFGDLYVRRYGMPGEAAPQQAPVLN